MLFFALTMFTNLFVFSVSSTAEGTLMDNKYKQQYTSSIKLNITVIKKSEVQ